MALRCGMIGLPGCGKTTIFNAITAANASAYNPAEMNEAVINVPDSRIDKLVAMYHPRKRIAATLEVVDIPGIKKDENDAGTGRSSRLLTHVKDADALLHVVRCFDDPNIPFENNTIDPARDVEMVDLELLAADAVTLENKITRVQKKTKTGDKEALAELADCEKVHKAIQQGIPARKQHLSAHELKSVYECNLVSLKPVLYIANIKSVEDEKNKFVTALKQIATTENTECVVIAGKDEADISQMAPEERQMFMEELGLKESSMERLLGAAYRMLGLITFFTVGEDEVRAWTCHKGDKAPTAAGKIHTDLEKGFIRMEVIKYDDLIALGSEAAVAKAGKQHLEGKEYEVKDGDIVMVRFNVAK